MRLRRLVAGRLAPGLEHHHRLGVGGRAQRAHEAAGVLYAFHVDHDALRARVVGQEVQRIAQAQVGVRAQRDHAGKAHRVVARPVQDGGGERPRLAQQRQRAIARQRPGGAGVELQRRALDARRVGPQQVHALAPGDLAQLGCEFGIHPAADHQRAAAVDARGQLQASGQILRRQRQDGQIGPGLGQVGQRARGVHTQESEFARVALRAQRIAQYACLRRQAVGRIAAAGQHDDRAGGKQRGEVMLVHHGGRGLGQRPEQAWAMATIVGQPARASHQLSVPWAGAAAARWPAPWLGRRRGGLRQKPGSARPHAPGRARRAPARRRPELRSQPRPRRPHRSFHPCRPCTTSTLPPR